MEKNCASDLYFDRDWCILCSGISASLLVKKIPPPASTRSWLRSSDKNKIERRSVVHNWFITMLLSLNCFTEHCSKCKFRRSSELWHALVRQYGVQVSSWLQRNGAPVRPSRRSAPPLKRKICQHWAFVSPSSYQSTFSFAFNVFDAKDCSFGISQKFHF